jgi:hypothetical protein
MGDRACGIATFRREARRSRLRDLRVRKLVSHPESESLPNTLSLKLQDGTIKKESLAADKQTSSEQSKRFALLQRKDGGARGKTSSWLYNCLVSEASTRGRKHKIHNRYNHVN